MGLFDFLKGRKPPSTSKKSSTGKRKNSSSSASTKAERSAANKAAWANKSAKEKTERTSRKATTSDSSTKYPTKAERSAANKKAWAEKSAQEKAERATTKSNDSMTSSNKPLRTEWSTPNNKASANNPKATKTPKSKSSPSQLTRAERSVLNKQAWAEKSAQEKAERSSTRPQKGYAGKAPPASSPTSQPGRPKPASNTSFDTAKKGTLAEGSAANKKAWADEPARNSTDRSVNKQRIESPTKFPSDKAKSTEFRAAPRTDPITGRNLSRAERSAINKENHRSQQENLSKEGVQLRKQRKLEEKALATNTSSENRRDYFPTQKDYAAYRKTDKWKKTRDTVIKKSHNKCEICAGRGSEVHHIRYSEPGKEHSSHLICVCTVCHRRIHGTNK